MKQNTLRKLLFLLFLLSGCASTDTVMVPDADLDSSKIKPSKALGPPLKSSGIPSFPENVSYRKISGFPEYVIGSGDKIKITLWNKNTPEVYEVHVRANGKISFLFLDYLTVAGLTPTEVDSLLTEKLKLFYRKPKLDVILQEYKHHNVFLLGEVQQIGGDQQSGAGKYPLKGKTTLLELVLNAGGPSDSANLSKVVLFRDGVSYPINLYKRMFKGEETVDIILENNDRILIPPLVNKNRPEKSLYVLGEVKQPGIVKFKENLSLIKILVMAGGYTNNAIKSQIRIIRGDINNPMVLTSDISKFLENGDLTQNIQVQDGDIIYVPQKYMVSVGNFLKQFQPIIGALLYPAMLRDMYTTGGGLKINTGGTDSPSTTTVLQTQ